jgi:phytoene dehydrogenase-like protein
MAAAWHLRQSGAAVTLVEARHFLGGRLTSHESPNCPTPFDNGPHLLLSSYSAARRLFRELGIADRFEFPYPGRIPFISGNGIRTALQEWPLPAPLNLLAGLLSFPLLSMRARRRIVSATKALQRDKPEFGQSAKSWLESHGEGEEIELFWNPLLRAVMNAPADAVPLSSLQTTFKEGFCKGAFGGRLGYAKAPLEEIFNVRARQALEMAGVEIQLKCPAIGAEIQNGRIAGVRLKDGLMLPCEAVVAALPPWGLKEWLAGVAGGNQVAQSYKLDDWAASSIAILYLWAEERPLIEAYQCLPGRCAEWIFDYAQIWGNRQAPVGVIVNESTVNGGAHRDQAPSKAPLRGLQGRAPLQDVLDDLYGALPPLSRVRWAAHRLIIEKRATPLKPKELWGKLLPQTTAIRGLYLAGDWLHPNLPPTVEAGVRMGEAAATAFAKDFS